MKINFFRWLFSAIIFSAFSFQSYAQTVNPYEPDPNTPNTYEGWSYAWGDEFNYTGAPDPDIWDYEKGFVRNSELQWYQPGNASVADGRLLIEGRRETFKNPDYVAGSSDWRTNRQYVNYTSSSLISCMKKQFFRGRIEVRAKLDTRKGNWPAIWTLGQNKEWPSNGEIDILEYYLLNGTPSILANFAWGTSTRWVAAWNSKATPLSYFTGKDADWANKYHVWRMDWDETSIKLYLDNELFNTQLIGNAKNGDGSICFNQPQYMILNLALGGNGGDPSATAFPTKYEVDYFRVYQKIVDLEKPSIVTDIAATNISNSSCTLTWTSSTDNVGVIAYHLYNNGTNGGSYVGSTTTNSMNVTGLSAGSNNSIVIRAMDAAGNYSDVNDPIKVTTVPCLSGKVCSYGDIWGNDANNAPEKVFDNNPFTFYDANIADGAWVGLDLTNKYKITKIRFCPRSSHPQRMTGGKFQGANMPDFSDAADLYTVSTTLTVGAWGEANINNSNYYRYVRYLSPSSGFCNVAEIEFYGATQATGLTEMKNGNPMKIRAFYDRNSNLVSFQSDMRSEKVELVVTNASGQLIFSKLLEEINGFKLDLSSFNRDLYVVYVRNCHINYTTRLVKL